MWLINGHAIYPRICLAMLLLLDEYHSGARVVCLENCQPEQGDVVL